MTTFYSTSNGDLDRIFITEKEFLDKYSYATLWAWGENTFTQLGTGNTTFYSSPVQIGTDYNWKQCDMSALWGYAGAIKHDGSVYFWGNGYAASPSLETMTDANKYALSQNTRAVIKKDGTLWLWGANNQGQLGRNNTVADETPAQTTVSGNNWKDISAGRFAQFLAIKTDGSLWGWGSNSQGVLGVGHADSVSEPTQIYGSTTDWKQCDIGQQTAAAIKKNGSLYTWGYASNGALGNMGAVTRSTPLRIGTANNWRYVSVGANGAHMLAIKNNGTLWGWGLNSNGQVGNLGSVSADVSTPVQIGTGTDWKIVRCSEASSYGIKTNGTLWAWGSNSYGALGLGDTYHRSSPVQVGTDTNWLNISGMDYCANALKYT